MLSPEEIKAEIKNGMVEMIREMKEHGISKLRLILMCADKNCKFMNDLFLEALDDVYGDYPE